MRRERDAASPSGQRRREQDEDDRPRRTRSGGKGLLVGLIVGGVVLVAAVVVVLVLTLGRSGEGGGDGSAKGGDKPGIGDAALPPLNPKESQLKDQLRVQLRAADANTRRNAIATAGQNKNLVAHLYDDVIAAWQDPADLVKEQVVNFLGFHHNKPNLAVPILIQAMSNRRISRGQVLHSLKGYGPLAKDAMPIVRQYILEVSDRQGSVYQDVGAYRSIGAKDEDVVSLLSAFLENKTFTRRDQAADMLAQIGPAARRAVPALLAYAQEPDRANRGFNSPAYQALKKIDPEAARKAGVP